MNPKKIIRKILGTIFYTSDNKGFIDYDEAELHEYGIILRKFGKEKEEKKAMDILKFIMEVLEKYNYGVYHKINPVQKLETQDSAPLFRINSVEISEVEETIIKEYELFTKKQHQKNEPSQEDSVVNKNSESG
jgi:hypothetical protein